MQHMQDTEYSYSAFAMEAYTGHTAMNVFEKLMNMGKRCGEQ